MKGGRRSRATGGENEAEEDVKDKPPKRSSTGTSAPDSGTEAEEMKKGGRAKKYKRGGKTEVGHIEGHKAPMHAGRKPRKSGGRASSDANPFTSAKTGRDAPGRKVMKGEEGFGEI